MTQTPSHAETGSRRSRWLPSISVVLWLVFFLAINLSDARVTMISSDSDSCWHWQQGNWMLQHHAVLRTEIFSHTRPGAPLIDLWWLSEIVMALAGNLFGWGGIILVASIVCATAIWLLHRELLAEGNELLLSTLLALLAAAVCATHWLARPHLVTQLLVVVFAWQLRWFDRDRVDARRLLVLLPVLTALWANLHGEFVAAFVLIGLYWIGTLVEGMRAPANRRPASRRQLTALTVLGGACFVASWLNPHGLELFRQILHDVRNPFLMGFAQDCLPPDFRDLGTLPFVLVSVAALSTLLIARSRLKIADAALLIVWWLLSLRMVRNAPLFALAATPIIAEHWNAYLRTAAPSRFMQRYRNISASLTSVDRMAGGGGLPALAIAAMVLVLASPQFPGGRTLITTKLPADRFPARAVEFLRQSPDAVHGEMFNEYKWGGYFTLAMPERKVFIHPNFFVYGETVVRDFLQVNGAQPGWEDVLKKYDVGWTILPRKHQLNSALARSADWSLVYTDQVASIYGRAR